MPSSPSHKHCVKAHWATGQSKATMSKAGAIGLLMNQLISLKTERSATNASAALAALAEKNQENAKLVSSP